MSNENGSKKPAANILSNKAIKAKTFKVFTELLKLIKDIDFTNPNNFSAVTSSLEKIKIFDPNKSELEDLLKMISEKHSSIVNEKEKRLLKNAETQLQDRIEDLSRRLGSSTPKFNF